MVFFVFHTNNMRETNGNIIILVSVIFSACACAATPPRNGAPSIVEPNGAFERNYPEAVRLYVPRGKCSAVVISAPAKEFSAYGNKLVLTAAHCTESAKPEDIVVHADYGDFPVAEIAAIPGRDVAFLSARLPERAPSLELSGNPEDITSVLEFVGFGCSPVGNDFYPLEQGTKRRAEFVVASIEIEKRPAPGMNPALIIAAADFHVCPGDSGGPIVSQSSKKVIAIAVQKIFVMGHSSLNVGVAIEEVTSFSCVLSGVSKC